MNERACTSGQYSKGYADIVCLSNVDYGAQAPRLGSGVHPANWRVPSQVEYRP
jgi:hypothetical protein